MMRKPIFVELSPIPDEPPSYDMKAENFTTLAGFEPRLTGKKKSNALTTEPKSRLSDTVVRDWI